MKCICKRPACRYEWESKTNQKPKACPQCKSYDWDKEVKKK